ncbi:MAG: peptidylprolyl isomerase [Gammaproteobacteria bacterium]|nr:peptidylprolyl isomerase [Gammaproteobacteria bacterium]MDD9960051.1 peptidylprolyl isomerase [Gammaproteobacteria bacterium]
MTAVIRQLGDRAAGIFLVLIVAFSPLCAFGGTIVRVSTSIGDFSIELLDETAPITVQNFLNYVNRNDYNGTYFHRVVDDFVAQGGAYRFELFVGPIDIPTDPPIQNEFTGQSNLRGTVAMARIAEQPNSATNQWFVNLQDNTDLDTVDGGFTVFGNVLGEGMQIVDALDDLPTIDLGLKASDAPYWTTPYTDPRDFVFMNVEVVERLSGAPHVLETNSGLLITSVDIDNGSDLISMNFNSIPAGDEVVIQANLESVIRRRGPVEGVATFSTADTRLRIPTLEVNMNGNVILVSNVVFALTNTSPVQFTLESFQQ